MTNYEYHVGCGIFEIYAGTLNKKGDMWLHKSIYLNNDGNQRDYDLCPACVDALKAFLKPEGGER